MQYDLKNKKRPKWCAIYGIASPFQTETHLRSFVPVSRVVFCKRLKVSPYIWDSSRPCTSVNLNGGNGALRLAPDRPSVASDRRVLRSDPIRSANPNQFPSISSLKRGVIHVLSSRCRQSPLVLTLLSHCMTSRSRTVPTTLAPPAASARRRSAREREGGIDRE